LSPPIVSDDVIVAASGRELPSFEYLSNPAAPLNGAARGTEGVIFHTGAVHRDVVADKQQILENVKGEAGSVAVDMVGLDSMMKFSFAAPQKGRRSG
jgi:hypothetical protein